MDNPFSIIDHRLKVIEDLLQRIHGDESHSESKHETYLRIEMAAEFLSTTQNALRVMVHKGQINYIKKQGKLFFRRSDLIEWLESGASDDNS
ncbi:helix-turn-helix domain-containing protein [Pedobacter ginsengisoli]|nr:helix-turn-helix domain-containing protein [Pedobacter ginsengisoli]